MNQKDAVQIGTTLLFRVAFLMAAAYLVYVLRDIVLLVLFAILTSMALNPAIQKLRRRGWSRSAAVLIVYAVIFLGGVALLALFLPLFFSEVKDFVAAWPTYVSQLDASLQAMQAYFHEFGVTFGREQFFGGLEGPVSRISSDLFSTTVDIVRGLIHFIGYFFLSLYLSLEEKGLEKLFLILTPKEYHAQALSFVARMRSRVSQWLFGQLILMAIAFVLYYIGLTLIGVPYALAIALFGALMEILPYIGPILAAIPAILVGLLVSPVLGLAALAFYTVAHQLEAHVFAPQVMRRSAELNPVGFILAVLVGFELAGPVGIILAVPVAMIVSLYVDDLLEKKSSETA
jgi:predicted PurR-regulated permease PerM